NICDYIEYLLSKADDAVTKNSLNPIFVSKGSPIVGTDGADDITGTVVNMEVDGDFYPTVTNLDSATLKLLLEDYLKQFYVIAQIPSIGGQQNVANLSEISLKLLYASTEGKALETTKSLTDGFNQRFAYFRKLLALDGITFSDEDFNSIGVTYSLRRPVDSKSAMEEMKLQRDMGAISKITIMENSQWTNDVSEEIRRIEDEIHSPAKEGDNIISNNESTTRPTETIAVDDSITKEEGKRL
ncbi:phage portal protein, partial [Ruminococcaceae bacterium OttesenSCG-928-O06]|nr:phage portal protein [Ruminococcaceae bacterium OttesenSCG-928-O06]